MNNFDCFVTVCVLDDSVAPSTTADTASNKSAEKVTESAKKPRFTCTVCNASFARKAYLQKHRKAKKHEDEDETSNAKSNAGNAGDKMNLTFPLASSGKKDFFG